MPNTSRVRLRADLTYRLAGDDTVYVLSESSTAALRGTLSRDLVEAAREPVAVDDLLDRLAERHPRERSEAAIRQLREAGLLRSATVGEGPADVLAGLDALLAADDAIARGTREPFTVAVVATGRTKPGSVELLAEALGGGFAVDGAGPPDCVVVLADDYLAPEVAEAGRGLSGAATPWLLAKPTGLQVLVGPLFAGAGHACFSCLRTALERNRMIVADAERPAPATPWTRTLGIALLADAVANTLVGARNAARLAGRVTRMDTRSLTVDRHEVVKRPQCRECGSPEGWQHRWVPGAADTTPDGHGNGSRLYPAEQTLARLRKHVSPLTGWVDRLEPTPGTEAHRIHGYRAGRNLSLGGSDASRPWSTIRESSGGKGRTAAEAEVGALCEALERACGVWDPDRAETVAAPADLDPATVVGLERLLHFSDSQFAGRTDWNRENLGFHWVPRPADPAQAISWTGARSLTTDEPRLLPSAYVWYGHPDTTALRAARADSNGCAAGNTYDEAVLQGFYELVERDSVALWWYNRSPRPAVDLTAVADPYLDEVAALHRRLGREFWVLDVTADLDVPAYVAVSRRRTVDDQRIMLGFGAHGDPAVALSRAVSEMIQLLPNVEDLTGRSSEPPNRLDRDLAAWLASARVETEDWLAPHGVTGLSPAGGPVVQSAAGLRRELTRCLDRARSAGLDVVVCDQTRPEIELAVVKVVVPGLRHFWRRLGPGRLYDVPVALGRRDTAIAESDVNPWNVFL
ncbi:TOMM precursor leader peptide-binding protein [Cryptosporangium japonicum]|uniref:TOMM leader peptide-binding protein n=1 Tax=Cryptosporangium japonicum TaxID=80872 RepID=A0ABP3DWI8_9ACTN